MNKFRLALFLALSVLVLTAAEPSTPAPPVQPKATPQEWYSWLKGRLSQEQALQALANSGVKLNSANPSAFSLRVQAQKIRTMATYPFVEYDTQLSKSWLNNFAVALDQLAKQREELFKLRHQTNTPEYRQLQGKYDQLAAAFLRNLQKPAVVTDKAKLNQLEADRKEALNRLLQREAQQRAAEMPAPTPAN